MDKIQLLTQNSKSTNLGASKNKYFTVVAQRNQKLHLFIGNFGEIRKSSVGSEVGVPTSDRSSDGTIRSASKF